MEDPLEDYEAWEQRQEDRLNELPVCVECDMPIQDEYCYEILGDYICPDCMERIYKVLI